MKFKKLLGSTLAGALTLSAFAGGAISMNAGAALSAGEDSCAGATTYVTPYAERATEDEDYGYLLVHFLGDGYQGGTAGAKEEQLYFTVSPDAKDWYIANNGDSVSPITTSKPAGSTGGIRDPHIVRKHDPVTGLETDGFYIIATDLSICHLNEQYGGACWGESQWQGSHSIIIWEMDKDMKLSEPVMKEIAPKNAGCTWAPEAIWDNEKNQYMVFWSTLGWRSWNQDGSYDEWGKDWAHHVYRCYTSDFNTFTEPEIYMESEQQIIDTTILKEGDTYYRFTKVETADTDTDRLNPKYGAKTVFMEEGKSLSGEFRMVSTYSINGKHWSSSENAGYEGAEIFKLNARDCGGTQKWCLALDNYGAGGYKPFLTEDISEGKFVAANMNFKVATRHGGFLPLKKSEFNKLCAKYSVPVEEEREHKMVFSMSFEDNTDVNQGSATVAGTGGTFEYVEGITAGTKAAKFGNGNYIKIDKSALMNGSSCLDSFTVSFAAKFSTRTWAFYAAPNNDEPSYNNENYLGVIWGESGSDPYLDAQRFKGGRNSSTSSKANGKFAANSNDWKHITIVFGLRSITIYVDGVEFATHGSTGAVKDILGTKNFLQQLKYDDLTIYIGRAQWPGPEFSGCVLDEYRIHNWGMSAAEVAANYKSVMGVN